MLHGLVFGALLLVVVTWLLATVPAGFLAVLFLECLEVLENSPPIIERYRTVTIFWLLSGIFIIANSIVDWPVALEWSHVPGEESGASVVVFVATELLLLATIRDCLAQRDAAVSDRRDPRMAEGRLTGCSMRLGSLCSACCVGMPK